MPVHKVQTGFLNTTNVIRMNQLTHFRSTPWKNVIIWHPYMSGKSIWGHIFFQNN
jgi:hypothetical protein